MGVGSLEFTGVVGISIWSSDARVGRYSGSLGTWASVCIELKPWLLELI